MRWFELFIDAVWTAPTLASLARLLLAGEGGQFRGGKSTLVRRRQGVGLVGVRPMLPLVIGAASGGSRAANRRSAVARLERQF
mgnify:CR=1 FL=1